MSYTNNDDNMYWPWVMSDAPAHMISAHTVYLRKKGPMGMHLNNIRDLDWGVVWGIQSPLQERGRVW